MWPEDEDDEEEERGYYEDTRAKGVVRRKKPDATDGYTEEYIEQMAEDEDDEEYQDDRDQYEDFELITQKFIPYIHEITDEILERDLRNKRDSFHLYKADWQKEKTIW